MMVCFMVECESLVGFGKQKVFIHLAIVCHRMPVVCVPYDEETEITLYFVRKMVQVSNAYGV